MEAPEMDLARRQPARSAGSFLVRIAYWSPVLVCMVLFAQVAFLGLRPAVCERRRLAEAQALMDARHARELALRDRIAVSLRARSDPIFLERRRRQRLHEPLLAPLVGRE